jgi:bifunctional aspartokinase / homoserine dehydrogenase 1
LRSPPDGTVPVVTGFLGATRTGERTTLGKGGSDYTAAVLGWAVRAEEVEIWTDVPGVMTADPRVVPDARPLRHLGFSEVLELSHWGAKVVHQKTVRPCRDRGIPLSIRNTMSPDDPGTLVTPRAPASKMGPVRGIASIDRVALFQLSGVGHGTESVTGRFLHALDRRAARCSDQPGVQRALGLRGAPAAVGAAGSAGRREDVRARAARGAPG